MSNPQNGAFLGNISYKQGYNEHVISLVAKLYLGEFTGGLLGIYRDDHGWGWQNTLIMDICACMAAKNLVLRLFGTLPEVKDAEEWLFGFDHTLAYAYLLGVRMFQFSNEPNNPDNPEPYDTYRERWLAVRNLLKARYPDCLCLNPGYVPNVEEDKWVALLIDDADLLALHCKWEG